MQRLQGLRALSDKASRLRHTPHDIYDHIRGLAVAGQLPPMRLVASNLAETYKTSVTPVREALARLMADGFIVQHRNRGFYSKPFTVLEQRELHMTSLALVSGALKATIKIGRAWPEDLAAKPLADPAERLAVQLETLACALVDGAGNSVIAAFSRLTLGRTRLIRRLDLRSPEVQAKLNHDLEQVLAGLNAKDAERAETALAEIVHDRSGRLERLVDEANGLASSVRDPWRAYR